MKNEKEKNKIEKGPDRREGREMRTVSITNKSIIYCTANTKRTHKSHEYFQGDVTTVANVATYEETVEEEGKGSNGP